MNGGGGSRAGQRGPAGTHRRCAGGEDAVGVAGQGRAVPQRLCRWRGVPGAGAIPRKRHSHCWCLPLSPPRAGTQLGTAGA